MTYTTAVAVLNTAMTNIRPCNTAPAPAEWRHPPPKFRRIYIAGPMTGFTAYNVGLFREEAAQARMRYGPALVITPFETNSRVWRRHYGRDFDPYHDHCDYGDPLVREMITEDVHAMLASDLVIALDGWMRSRVAGVEVQLAHLAAIPVVNTFGEPILVRAVVNWQEPDEVVVV